MSTAQISLDMTKLDAFHRSIRDRSRRHGSYRHGRHRGEVGAI